MKWIAGEVLLLILILTLCVATLAAVTPTRTPTPTRTQTPTRTITQTPTITQTHTPLPLVPVTGTPGVSSCIQKDQPPCDLYEFQSIYPGGGQDFVADYRGPFPPETDPNFPWGSAQGAPEPPNLPTTTPHFKPWTFAYRVHNVNGWSRPVAYTVGLWEPGFAPTATPTRSPTPTRTKTRTPAPNPTPTPCSNVGFPYGKPGPFGNCYNCNGDVVGIQNSKGMCGPIGRPTRPHTIIVTRPPTLPTP